MFILKNRESYFWPVKFQLPGSSGKAEQFDFQIEFRMLAQSRIDELFSQIQLRSESVTDESIAREVVIGWKDIASADGDPLLFNSDNLSQLLDVPNLRSAIVKGFFESVAGIKQKN